MDLDVLIFGGGIAGLWLLAELQSRGHAVLLIERRALGAGQTIASQGILHGGLKYMLGGMVSGSAKAVGEMTEHWRACLAGEAEPDLRAVRVASPHCFLWRTESLTSRAALTAARFVLRTAVERVDADQRPAVLGRCPGEVLCVDEQVIDVRSLLHVLAEAHADRLLFMHKNDRVKFLTTNPGRVCEVRVHSSAADKTLAIAPRAVVFAAGEGNEELRAQVELPVQSMQCRPLHMAMVRGPIPALFGHCVDGNKTRVTITSAVDHGGRTVWQLGGEIAERGVDMAPSDLIRFAQSEVGAVLPGVDFSQAEWATYRINRAEGRMPSGARPDGPVWRTEGNVITAWPTKLVLAPRLAASIADSLGTPVVGRVDGGPILPPRARPEVALPPWETCSEWRH